MLLLAGGAGVLVRRDLPVALVDPHDPAVELDRAITETFGIARPIVWIVEARGGSIWTPAMLAHVQAVTRDVFRIPGVVAPDVISIASPNLRDLVVSEAGMRPTYLMAAVPETAEAMAALRARVDGDPMLRGQLVDRAGRAAMVVANFRESAETEAIAQAALALAERHANDDVAVWVVGAPVLAHAVRAHAAGFAVTRVLPGVVVLLGTFALLLGWRRAAGAVVAAIVTGVATLAGAAAVGVAVLPWTALAGIGGMLLAGTVVVTGPLERRAARGAIAGVMVGLGVGAAAAPGAEQALAWGGLVAVPLALGVARLTRTALATSDADAPGAWGRAWRITLAGGALLLATGTVRLGPGFALASYGERYLPVAVAPDVAALARLFPPPQSLAMRVRGEPGFVTSPEVLAAFEHATDAAAADATVRHATSIADLVKIVHRAFNDGRPEFAVLPEDRGLIARYLALAYSPGFRRFVDRALGSAAIWIMLDDADPADLARVERRVERALATRPVPGARVDRWGGDGAVTLAMAASARRVAVGSLLVVGLAVLGAALAGAPRSAMPALAGAAVATVVVAGLLGWCGQAFDLVTVPLLAVVPVVVLLQELK